MSNGWRKSGEVPAISARTIPRANRLPVVLGALIGALTGAASEALEGVVSSNEAAWQSHAVTVALVGVSGALVAWWATVLRTRADQRRQSRDRRFASMLENSADIVTLLDEHGTILYESASVTTVLGYEPRDLVGRSAFDLIAGSDRDLVYRTLAECADDPGKRTLAEYAFVAKDGSHRMLQSTARNMLDDPDVRAIVVNSRDITERVATERALREAEERFSLMQDLTGDALYKLRFATRTYDYVSPSIEALTGYTAAEIREAGFEGIIQRAERYGPEGPTDLSQAEMDSLFTKGQSREYRADYLITTRSGEHRWIADRSYPWRDEDGSSIGSIGVLQDITSRKEAEAAVRRSEERLTLAFQAGGMVVWDWDLRSGALEWTQYISEAAPGFGTTVKSTRDELDAFISPEDIGALRDAERRAIDTGSDYTVEVQARAPGGAPRALIVRGRILRGANGEPERSVGIAIDITERKAEQGRLQVLSRAVEQSPASVVITDPQGNIEYVNRKFLEISGYSAEEVLGQNPRILKSGQTPNEEYQRLWQTITAGQEWDGDLSNRKKNGSIYWEHASISPVLDEAGGIAHFVAVKEDVTRQRAAQQRIRSQFEQLTALRAIDAAIASSHDPRVSLGVVLDQLTALVGVDAGAAFYYDPSTLMLEFAADRGFRGRSHAAERLRLGEGLAGKAALDRRIVDMMDLHDPGETLLRRPQLRDECFADALAVPLIARGEVRGVLELFHRSRLELSPDQRGFVETLAGQAAIAIDSATMFAELQRTNNELMVAYDATIEGWAQALDLRDQETEGHSRRVSDMAVRLAKALNVPDSQLIHIRRGALLHDIGKMAIPDSILLKPEKLTDEELAIMKRHTTYGHELLSQIPFLRPALAIPLHHHERWDGTGYPYGLRGNHIPLPARIFAVVDVWDALRSDRPYRPAWPVGLVREHIEAGADTHFDPEVVNVFAALLDQDDAAAIRMAA